MGLMFWSFQCRAARKLFFMQMLSFFCFIAQFLLLGAYTGAITLSIGVCRNYLLSNEGKPWADWKGWPCIIIAAYMLSCYATWESWLSLLPSAAIILSTLAGWTHNGKIIRLVGCGINSPLWIIYDFCVNSWGGVIGESISMLSIFISFYRYGMKGLDGKGETEK